MSFVANFVRFKAVQKFFVVVDFVCCSKRAAMFVIFVNQSILEVRNQLTERVSHGKLLSMYCTHRFMVPWNY